MSSVYYRSHAEPNVYFQPQLMTGTASHYRNPALHQNSRDETSDSSSIQQRDTVNIIDTKIKKQMKKIKMMLIVAVSVIGVFLALAIGLSFLATVNSQKQLPLPDIDEEVNKHVAPLQGNLTVLNNQLTNIYTEQLNQYAQLTQQMNEYDQQAKTLNDITESIGDDLTEYTQKTERVDDSVNQNRAAIEQMRNNYYSTNIPSKFMYLAVSSTLKRATHFIIVRHVLYRRFLYDLDDRLMGSM